jgi:hypothetical protein
MADGFPEKLYIEQRIDSGTWGPEKYEAREDIEDLFDATEPGRKKTIGEYRFVRTITGTVKLEIESKAVPPEQ